MNQLLINGNTKRWAYVYIKSDRYDERNWPVEDVVGVGSLVADHGAQAGQGGVPQLAEGGQRLEAAVDQVQVLQHGGEGSYGETVLCKETQFFSIYIYIS